MSHENEPFYPHDLAITTDAAVDMAIMRCMSKIKAEEQVKRTVAELIGVGVDFSKVNFDELKSKGIL